ncbi:MAG: GNAT family N-acetyltransferase [Parvibaculum sp.]
MIAATLALAGNKLRLRPFSAEDAPRVAELLNNWNVASMLARVPFPYTQEGAVTWIATHNERREAGTDWPFAIETKNGLVGTIGIHQSGSDTMELGYWIGEPYWGKGITSEAARVLINFSFDILNLETLASNHYADNPASGRILTKSGFEKTGEGIRPCLARDKDLPSIEYHLTRERWQAQNKLL